jgi:hypothetical protein
MKWKNIGSRLWKIFKERTGKKYLNRKYLCFFLFPFSVLSDGIFSQENRNLFNGEDLSSLIEFGKVYCKLRFAKWSEIKKSDEYNHIIFVSIWRSNYHLVEWENV